MSYFFWPLEILCNLCIICFCVLSESIFDAASKISIVPAHHCEHITKTPLDFSLIPLVSFTQNVQSLRKVNLWNLSCDGGQSVGETGIGYWMLLWRTDYDLNCCSQWKTSSRCNITNSCILLFSNCLYFSLLPLSPVQQMMKYCLIIVKRMGE